MVMSANNLYRIRKNGSGAARTFRIFEPRAVAIGIQLELGTSQFQNGKGPIGRRQEDVCHYL